MKRIQAAIQFLFLFFRQWNNIRDFCNAIPNVCYQQDTLGNTQTKDV